MQGTAAEKLALFENVKCAELLLARIARSFSRVERMLSPTSTTLQALP
jgi:hypothetical protein